MAKGTELSKFAKSEFTALKRIRISQREFSKALGWSKTVICNYLKSPNKYGTRKPTGSPEKLSPLLKRRIVHEVKKKTSSTLKILKFLLNTPCSICSIWRHLNNERIKHEKIIHRPRFTMKHKEKRLEYARQYQTKSAVEWRKVFFLDEKKCNLKSPDGFKKFWYAKDFPKENYLTMHFDWWWWSASDLQENYNFSVVDKKQQII